MVLSTWWNTWITQLVAFITHAFSCWIFAELVGRTLDALRKLTWIFTRGCVFIPFTICIGIAFNAIVAIPTHTMILTPTVVCTRINDTLAVLA